MKIAILGHGKMGQVIEKIALQRGHEIILKTNSQNPAETADFLAVEVAIDFSTPDTAFNNISSALTQGIPVTNIFLIMGLYKIAQQDLNTKELIHFI